MSDITYFHIMNPMTKMFLDVQYRSDWSVIVYPKNSPNSDNQLWYMNPEGVILSKIKGYALHSQGKGKEIKVDAYTASSGNMFRFYNNEIKNDNGDCLEIRNCGPENRPVVIAGTYTGESTQQWEIDFV